MSDEKPTLARATLNVGLTSEDMSHDKANLRREARANLGVDVSQSVMTTAERSMVMRCTRGAIDQTFRPLDREDDKLVENMQDKGLVSVTPDGGLRLTELGINAYYLRA